MADKGGFDYLDAVSKDEGGNKNRLSNMQVQQTGLDASPAEGGEGYVGGNPNASTFGTEYVTGKKGYSIDRPIWSEQSSQMGVTDNTGSADGDAKGIQGQQDDTDQYASYKRIQNDEGLPQTYRDSKGAGDAGPSGTDEPIGDGGGNPNAQSVPSSSVGDHELSDMPQTEFTSNDGGGAPLFKHRG